MPTIVGPSTLFQEDGEIRTSDFTPEGDSGSAGLVDVSKPSDLKSSSRQKLGSYLRSATSQNYYRISDSTTPPVVSSPGSLGTPPLPDESSSNAQNSFLSQALADARNNFNSLSANNPELASVIDKNSQVLGHALLNVDVESSNGSYLSPDKPDSTEGNVPEKISSSLKSNRFSQGYYLSINRNVFRDLERLERVIDQSKHMWQGDNRNFETGGAVTLAVLESINILLDTLGNSQTFKFANAMSNLGDICLLSSRGGFGGLGEDAPKINFRSDIVPLLEEPKNLLDSSTPDIGNIHTKSRAKFDRSSRSNSRTEGMGLAWRFGAYSSAYILPTTLISAVRGDDTKPLVINDSYISNQQNDRGSKFRSGKDVVNGRITREAREKLEAHLNAAHMPFYFHDLRTNEIIAFWAFLESISDSFTPEINQVTGFGRMDNVQIYKRTGRAIHAVLADTNCLAAHKIESR